MMRPRSITTLTLATALLVAAVGCGGGPRSDDSAAARAGGDPNARTLPIPGESGDGLPAGHPPIDGAAPGAGSAAAAGALMAWDTPEAWVEESPASSMRHAQYRVPGPGGEGECVVYYFGPGQGGEPVANAQRWAGQFTRPDGSPALPDMTMTPLEGAAAEVSIVEVAGTYDGGMSMTDAPASPQPDSMLLGGIARGPDAFWFVKFTGPRATVEANREAFLAMMRSMRAAG